MTIKLYKLTAVSYIEVEEGTDDDHPDFIHDLWYDFMNTRWWNQYLNRRDIYEVKQIDSIDSGHIRIIKRANE